MQTTNFNQSMSSMFMSSMPSIINPSILSYLALFDTTGTGTGTANVAHTMSKFQSDQVKKVRSRRGFYC